MSFKLIVSAIVLLTLCACSWNNQPVQQQQADRLLPNREDSVSLLSRIHTKLRDLERGSYSLMYGIRDGADSFVYDIQKDYYQDYQK
jgi:hypothetical protein